VDLGGDLDLDLLVGNHSNRVVYFENVGTRRKPQFVGALKLVHDACEHFSFRSRPAPSDWDGDFDLFANEQSQIVLYRNVGTNRVPKFRRELSRFYGEPISVSDRGTSVRPVDWDRDWACYFHRATLDQVITPVVSVKKVRRRR